MTQQYSNNEFDFLQGLEEDIPSSPPSLVDRTATRLPQQPQKTVDVPAQRNDRPQKPTKPAPALTPEMLNADRIWQQLGLLHERTILSTVIFSLFNFFALGVSPSGVLPVVYSLFAAIAFIGGITAFKATRRLLILRITLQMSAAFILSSPFFFLAQFF